VPRTPQKATGQTAYLQIRLPGTLKNQIIDHCQTLEISLNTWLIEAVQTAIRNGMNMPTPPPAKAPLPTTADMIRQWATGERILTPCGKETCPATEGDYRHSKHDGQAYCNECGIRVI
jgi:hypothetical protein